MCGVKESACIGSTTKKTNELRRMEKIIRSLICSANLWFLKRLKIPEDGAWTMLQVNFHVYSLSYRLLSLHSAKKRCFDLFSSLYIVFAEQKKWEMKKMIYLVFKRKNTSECALHASVMIIKCVFLSPIVSLLFNLIQCKVLLYWVLRNS